MGRKLNDAQAKAVGHDSGPMLVVAGAGTGKTTVIVERIARLVAHGIDKQSILALTFTEKAAQEMLDRVSDRLNESYGVEMPIHTFNAFGQLLLQEFAVEIGMSSSLKLVGDDGKIIFMREHLEALQLDYFAPLSKPDGQLAAIADYFSELKQQLVTPDLYQSYADTLPQNDEAEKLERKKHQELAHAYEAYIRLMRERNIIDYDDQIYLLGELLESRPNILHLLQDRYQHIMVDEFQDTNPMQSRLIDLIYGVTTTAIRQSESQALTVSRTAGERSLMAVGDDDQAIYGWRGATLANILDFTNRYPEAKQVSLIENYRSTQEILDTAWQLIQHNNPDRLEQMNNLDKRLQAHRGKGKPPSVQVFSRPEVELGWIVDDIARRLKNGQEPGSIAVLARSRRGVAKMHDMLDSAGLDHSVAGLTEDLYAQPIVLTMVQALRAAWDVSDSVALYHTLAGRLFTCEAAVISELSHQSKRERSPLIELASATESKSVLEAVRLIKQWHEDVHRLTVRELAYRILTETGLKQELYKTAPHNPDAEHDVFVLGQWFNSLGSFERITITPSVLSYLDNFDVLRAEGETLDDGTLALRSDVPAVMTIHKSKGLEWQTVYLIDCAAGSFPHVAGGKSLKVPETLRLSSDADARLPEERRLMYVAATRARDELILSYSKGTRSTPRKPSRFIAEMQLDGSDTLAIDHQSAAIEHYLQKSRSQTISIPSSMKEGDCIVLSASQADDYLTCPLNFYYKHILCVPEPPTAQTEIGSLFHALIQQVNEARLHNRTPPAKNDLLTQLGDSWPTIGYRSKAERERARKHGIEAFDQLYDRLLTDPIPVAVEEKFRVRIPDSKLILKGRFDAVLSVEDEGVEVHDYKTSTSVQDAESAKKKTTASVQLTMYALAWRILHDEDPVQVSLDFVQTGHIGVVKKRSSSLDSMQEKLAGIVEEIQAGNFPPGSKHDYCIHPL